MNVYRVTLHCHKLNEEETLPYTYTVMADDPNRAGVRALAKCYAEKLVPDRRQSEVVYLRQARPDGVYRAEGVPDLFTPQEVGQ